MKYKSKAVHPGLFSEEREARWRPQNRRPPVRRFLSAGFLLAGWAAFASGLNAVTEPVQFRKDILPILSDHCFQCHGPDEKARKARLRLDTREGAFQVKEGIAVIAPGESHKSDLYLRVASSDADEIMPPPSLKRPLSGAQLELLKQWIDQGASWGEHWAFEKVNPVSPPIPDRFGERVRNPIDSFIFQRLHLEGLAPSEEAPKATLIRRLALDLTGLPPTPSEVESFLADASSLAYEKRVDYYLSSPAFGERMAWEWLDAARYADSNGYQGDAERTMWPWRDWVVEAFNRNLPYDQFTVWQLAGDLLPEATLEQALATGFSRNHMINGEGGRIAEENRVDYVMDMAETMGTVWLGLTLNCSRCHDHKYDPLTQEDYYRLYAYFNQTPVTGGGGDPQSAPNLELPTAGQENALRQAREKVRRAGLELEELERTFFAREEETAAAERETGAGLPEKVEAILNTAVADRNRGQLSELEKHFETEAPEYAGQVRLLRQATEQRENVNRSIARVMIMRDMPQPRQTFMLEAGLYDKPGREISAGVPAFLPPPAPEAPENRLGLARWLVEPENPLTARVTVNRVWQQFFGMGLVKTPEDFGVQGEFPKHPELLDWLAGEFVRSGWDFKHLCRLLVTSGTYKQSSKVTPELLEIDPENRLLGRAPRFRMPSWMIRDQALAASGLLVREIGGAPVNPYQPAGIWEEATFGTKKYQRDSGGKLYRRGIYTFWRRIVGPALFFDSASRQVCSVKEPRTNSPMHALATLNDVTYVEAARALAERVLLTAGSAPDERIDLAFRLVLARKASAPELELFRAALERMAGEFGEDLAAAESFLNLGESERNKQLDPVTHAAYAGVCLAILNLDEALTKE
jgi:hypothetical protein